MSLKKSIKNTGHLHDWKIPRYLDIIYNVTWNVIALPVCFAEIFPPWASAVAFAMERPMPVPLTVLEWAPSAR